MSYQYRCGLFRGPLGPSIKSPVSINKPGSKALARFYHGSNMGFRKDGAGMQAGYLNRDEAAQFRGQPLQNYFCFVYSGQFYSLPGAVTGQ